MATTQNLCERIQDSKEYFLPSLDI